ncbi:GtrA family protein [Lysobacter korlensis]|uniref:GtrA family protein n=1 Tax=Lysobacter korlensis TaxID=553636 RepID=A0ABV6RJ05_9GAMM
MSWAGAVTRLWRLARFLAAGATGYVIYYAVSWATTRHTNLSIGLSALVGVSVALLPTYHLQRHLTFKSSARLTTSLPAYAGLQVANGVIIATSATTLERFFGPSALWLALAGGIGIGVSYVIQSKFVFRQRISL